MADAAIVRGRVTDADGEGIGYAIVSVMKPIADAAQTETATTA